jgi:hypothetical protein
MKLADPLAQTFYVNPSTGIFVTSVELFFQTKDDQLPVTVQLRPIELGYPTNSVYPFSEVVLDANKVNVSNNASVPTKFTFDSPVYLQGGKFHALVVTSNSNSYNVWVSQIGEFDVSNLPEEVVLEGGQEFSRNVVTKQPNSGGLYKSQNSSTWVESPYEDLKFNLYRARFLETQGSINFYNPSLLEGNNQLPTLLKDSLEFTSRKIRVGLGTTVQDSGLTLGNTIIQQGSNGTGNYVGSAGSAFGTLKLINAGIGYTPSAGNYTYNNVSLTSLTGSGFNATANVSIQNGVAVAATITSGGTGYVVGDILTPTQVGLSSLGLNAQFSVSNIFGINQLIIDQVQGSFATGIGKTIQYINNSGITTNLNSSVGGNVTIVSDGIIGISDGLHIKVNHKNHGMHATENTVIISNVQSDILPTKLTTSYDSTSTSDIILQDATNFGTFENVGVGTTNPGYILIGKEIIAYEGVNANVLTGITRGIDGTNSKSYPSDALVFKYENSGISLRRINKQHILSDASVSDPIDLDYYTLKVNTSNTDYTGSLPQGITNRSSSSFPNLYINETKSSGGLRIKASKNIQFEMIRPTVETLTVPGTSISSFVRTVSGTSVDGTETSFLDKGFENIDLNSNNYFNDPRIICSPINESTKLDSLPGNKSFTLTSNLFTSNDYISPVIDLDRVGIIFTTNRINNPISNYAADDRVSKLENDPSSFVYATNALSLENSATSIKVLISAHINTYCDLRVLYSILNDKDESPIYYPFPGYVNKKRLDSGLQPDDSLSDGTPDVNFAKTDIIGFDSNSIEFKDYEFTIDNLPSFRYFSIKIIGSSTNQAYPPRLKDLRVIALA